MTERTFTCAECDGTFVTTWTEDEARAEYEQNLGTAAFGPVEEQARVCTACYIVLMNDNAEEIAAARLAAASCQDQGGTES
jgi:predicted  nucleic acid-binding Zn-ribbon protein